MCIVGPTKRCAAAGELARYLRCVQPAVRQISWPSLPSAWSRRRSRSSARALCCGVVHVGLCAGAHVTQWQQASLLANDVCDKQFGLFLRQFERQIERGQHGDAVARLDLARVADAAHGGVDLPTASSNDDSPPGGQASK